jgi:rubredoxin
MKKTIECPRCNHKAATYRPSSSRLANFGTFMVFAIILAFPGFVFPPFWILTALLAIAAVGMLLVQDTNAWWKCTLCGFRWNLPASPTGS